MRWTIILLAGFLVPLGSSTFAATPTSKNWLTGSATATAKPADIGVPLSAASLRNFALRDANEKGNDLASQYETPDGKVIGTIFLYAPTRPDAGLTWLATDEAIRRRLGANVRVAQDELIAIAGVADAGRRMAYIGQADAKLSGDTDGRVYSTATIFRAGEWLVKARVTGPISRSAEIGANLDALVAGMTFGKKVRPFPSKRLASSTCTAGADRKDVQIHAPPSGEALEVVLTLDSIADEAGKAIANPLLGDIERVCLERQEVHSSVPLLSYRVEQVSGGNLIPRMVMLHGDAGIMLLALETKKHPGEFFIARHSIGRTFIIGRASGLPSAAQLRAIILDPDNQPSVITVTEDYLSDPQSKQITINCNLTAEGCSESKK